MRKLKKEDLPEGYELFEVTIVDSKYTVAFIVAKNGAEIRDCEGPFFDHFNEIDYWWEKEDLEFSEEIVSAQDGVLERTEEVCCIVDGWFTPCSEDVLAVLAEEKERLEKLWVDPEQLPLFVD